MSSLFKKIKSINQWEKDLVIGYTKEAQKLVLPNQIPIPISYLCLVYHYESEYFDESTQKVDINKERDIATIIEDGGYGFAVGKVIIESKIPMIYFWTFQVFYGDNSDKITRIGISNRTIKDGKIKWNDGDEWFHMDDDCVAAGSYDDWDSVYHFDEFQHGDIIEMTLNTKIMEIGYFVNDKCVFIPLKNIDFKAKQFRMWVSFGNINQKIKLVKFEKVLR